MLKQLLGVGLIWLCSPTISQAETTQFVCDDWAGMDTKAREKPSFEGSFFIGKKTTKGYTIRNEYGTKIELVYIGDYNDTGVKLYSGINPKWSTSFYKPMTAYAVYTIQIPTDYDFTITKFRTARGNNKTRCKFE